MGGGVQILAGGAVAAVQLAPGANAIATADAMGRPELLATGISQALLTTAAGWRARASPGTRDGIIVTITEDSISGDETIDAAGLVVGPGVDDPGSTIFAVQG